MSNAKHTPAPWAFEPWGEEFPSCATVYSEAHGLGVGSIVSITPNGMRENSALADARLISAAPDLLALVKLVYGSFGGGLVVTFSEADVQEFAAAIAKAEAAA